MKITNVHTEIPVFFLKEDDTFVCYTPAFDLAASGDTLEEAKKSFDISCKMILEEVVKKGALEEMLQNYGWVKLKSRWSPPQLIGQESKDILIPVHS